MAFWVRSAAPCSLWAPKSGDAHTVLGSTYLMGLPFPCPFLTCPWNKHVTCLHGSTAPGQRTGPWQEKVGTGQFPVRPWGLPLSYFPHPRPNPAFLLFGCRNCGHFSPGWKDFGSQAVLSSFTCSPASPSSPGRDSWGQAK